MSSANSDFCLSFLSVNGGNGRQPTYDKAVAVASALGVSADYLLTGEQKEKPAPKRDGLKEIDAIFEQLTPSRQAKLLELARLYLADQRRNEET